MPSPMSVPDAIALPLVAMAALQALQKYNNRWLGGTVLVPTACQSRVTLKNLC
jgi:hypothetical protein